eukprot:2087699-Pyramimonas_sp.AAC.2
MEWRDTRLQLSLGDTSGASPWLNRGGHTCESPWKALWGHDVAATVPGRCRPSYVFVTLTNPTPC